mgnify:CR=1 FL=1
MSPSFLGKNKASSGKTVVKMSVGIHAMIINHIVGFIISTTGTRPILEPRYKNGAVGGAELDRDWKQNRSRQ